MRYHGHFFFFGGIKPLGFQGPNPLHPTKETILGLKSLSRDCSILKHSVCAQLQSIACEVRIVMGHMHFLGPHAFGGSTGECKKAGLKQEAQESEIRTPLSAGFNLVRFHGLVVSPPPLANDFCSQLQLTSQYFPCITLMLLLCFHLLFCRTSSPSDLQGMDP